jgi:hypothetical protein
VVLDLNTTNGYFRDTHISTKLPDVKSSWSVLFQDALRLYLINSPVVRAESLRFKRSGVYGVVS